MEGRYQTAPTRMAAKTEKWGQLCRIFALIAAELAVDGQYTIHNGPNTFLKEQILIRTKMQTKGQVI